eukprot:TRINITY_DN2464_c0_g1_i1.p1 TRINITY_DN2464_c0_g1~~TRINITY_DN2464_c0_g1_i1.p1  ORF type:complete len:742 (-),score=135.62 TRINITY_DN2464_c0_g1_i1:82-2307(-)
MSDFQWTHFDALKKKIASSHLIDLINIEQNLEVIMNGEEYFRKRHLEPPGSQASWNTRDQHMTLTIDRIKERLPLVTQSNSSASVPLKLLVWAHNSHIGDASATSRGGQDFKKNETWNLGQMVKQSIDKSFLLGFDTFSGTVTALGDDDTTQTYDLRPALEESMEYACHQICQEKGCDSFFLDLIRDDNSPDVSKFLSRKSLHRYVGVNYCPETELQSHYSLASLKGQYHGLIFIDATSALRILSADDLQPPAQGRGGNRSLATKQGHRRLVQEYRQIMRHPIPSIRVSPQEDNLWICHFLITFDFGDYKGGEYHGRLEIPQEYPMAPPRIFFMTPSGRFQTETRICVSFSDYHPELWNPSWGIESVLVGLQSFMQEDSPHSLGSISTPKKHRQELAAKSHEFNLKNAHYCDLFLNNPVTPSPGQEAEEKEEDRYCRYCRHSGGELVSPCNCEGGNKWVHLNCLAKWQYQAILSQSTHPKYQTGLEKKCNVCLSDFKIQQFTREQLMLNFTGAEMANLIRVGCLLIATEKSSAHNIRLTEQYPHLEAQLSYWTKNMFLVYNIERYKNRDGNYEDLIEGVGVCQEITRRQSKRFSSSVVSELKSLDLSYRYFIGGPVSSRKPFFLVSMKTSLFEDEDFEEEFKSVSFFQGEDLSIWSISYDNLVALFSQRNSTRAKLLKALVEVRVYWGCACWGRVQLLGEIARGGWGLANCVADSWEDPSVSWGLSVKRAVTAGKNDMSEH